MPSEDAAYGLWLLDQKRHDYQRFRNYEAGDQPWMYATPKMREIYDNLMRKYRLNVCRPVVRGVSRRVGIDAMDGDDSGWYQQQMQQHENRLWREAIRQGDGYLLAWPDGDMGGPLRTHRLRADECIVVYREDDQDTPEYAVKWWYVTAPDALRQDNEFLLRVNVFYPDRVERFVTRSTVTAPTTLQLESKDLAEFDGDGADSTISYQGTLQAAGRDGTLPVTHFACQPDATPYGVSILSDVIPPQDEINHVLRTQIASLEAFGLPLRVFTAFGVDEETHVVTDPKTGEDRTIVSDNTPDYHPAKDWALFLPGENSRAIQLPEADLTKLLEVRRAAIQNATLVSGVPLGMLAEDSGTVPSGVALRVVESPLTDFVVDLHSDWERPIRDHGRLYGLDVQPSWRSPISMDDTERHELALRKIELGIPAAKAVEDAGIMDAEMFTELQQEYADTDREFGSRLVDAFRDGQDPAELLRS